MLLIFWEASTVGSVASEFVLAGCVDFTGPANRERNTGLVYPCGCVAAGVGVDVVGCTGVGAVLLAACTCTLPLFSIGGFCTGTGVGATDAFVAGTGAAVPAIPPDAAVLGC